jgi:hypothetical protein
MGDVVNLSKHRKTKERALRQKQAEANRLRYGRTKGERTREETDAARAEEAHALLKFEAPAKTDAEETAEPAEPEKPGVS